VRLRSRSEIVVQVKGTIDILNGVEVLTSLTFITNERVYGPFGPTLGRCFESNPSTKVVGFFGRADSLLHQIGVITEVNASAPGSHQSHGTIVASFAAHQQSQGSTISHTISGYEKTSSSTVIDNGVCVENGHEHTKSIRVNGHENFDSVSNGTANSATKILVGYETNEALGSSGVPSKQPRSNGNLGPSYGDGQRSCDCGIEHCCCWIHEHHLQCLHQVRHVEHIEEGTIVHGPWGGLGGDLFCDGRGDIVEIVVAYNTERVTSLQVSYIHGSTTFKGSCHGGRGGNTAQVELPVSHHLLYEPFLFCNSNEGKEILFHGMRLI